MSIKKNTNYDFEARKQYEETFVRNNSSLIMELTGASWVYDISRSKLDRQSGIDAIIQIDKGLSGVALRVRRPKYKKYAKRFTIGHHITHPTSQIHSILNSINDSNVFYPQFILQVNGVNDEGYCEECFAILMQTNTFAGYLLKHIENNTLEDYYVPLLNAYEFEFSNVFTQTNTGVDLFHIKENQIRYVRTHKEGS